MKKNFSCNYDVTGDPQTIDDYIDALARIDFRKDRNKKVDEHSLKYVDLPLFTLKRLYESHYENIF